MERCSKHLRDAVAPRPFPRLRLYAAAPLDKNATINNEGSRVLDNQAITPFDAIGGAKTIEALTHRFYTLMDTLPEARDCRAIHPQNLEGSRLKLQEYLTGYLGGPQVYIQKYGHPRLRSRHLHAAIGPAERDQWLLCFRLAMEETVENEALRQVIWPPIAQLAAHMQNRN